MNGNFDFERIWEGKRKMRQRLAAAPIAEKLRMLDELLERALALRRGVPDRRTLFTNNRPVPMERQSVLERLMIILTADLSRVSEALRDPTSDLVVRCRVPELDCLKQSSFGATDSL